MLSIQASLLDCFFSCFICIVFAIVHPDDRQGKRDVDDRKEYPPENSLIKQQLCHLWLFNLYLNMHMQIIKQLFMSSRMPSKSNSDSPSFNKIGLPGNKDLEIIDFHQISPQSPGTHNNIDLKPVQKEDVNTKTSKSDKNLEYPTPRNVDVDDQCKLIQKIPKGKDFPKTFIRLFHNYLDKQSKDNKKNEPQMLSLKKKLRILKNKQTKYCCIKKNKITKDFMSELFTNQKQSNQQQYEKFVSAKIFEMLNNHKFIQEKITHNEKFRDKKLYLILLKLCQIQCFSPRLLKIFRSDLKVCKNKKQTSLNIQLQELNDLQNSYKNQFMMEEL